MTKISKFSFVGAILAIGIASPAFAQSFDPEVGTGNVLAFGYVQTAPQLNRVATHPSHREKNAALRSGANAFAMVPGIASGNAYTPQYIPGFGNVGAGCGSC
jgi:hypothetical protein